MWELYLCKKFKETVQTANFTVFTMCGRELPAILRGTANTETVGQNQFFLENKVVINFDFRSGAKKSGHLDYPFKSYDPKFVSMHKTCGEVGVKKKSHGYNFQFQASI